jgi:hypothetical protein
MKKMTAISDERKLKGDLSSNTPERGDSCPWLESWRATWQDIGACMHVWSFRRA